MNYKIGQGIASDKNLSEKIQKLKQVYKDVFGKGQYVDDQNIVITRAPGRAEIIGNHTDYSGGYTISANIEQELLMLGSLNNSNKIKIISLDKNSKVISFSILSAEEIVKQKSSNSSEDAWTNYIKGIVWVFVKEYLLLKGFSIVIQSSIPMGGGVSSSAALELAAAYFICAVNNFKIPSEILARMCKDAENNYVGAPCGFLDQATVALADRTLLFMSYKPKKNNPFTWDILDINLGNFSSKFIIGFDPKSQHSLVKGKYAIRQSACKQSVPVLEKALDKKIQVLSDVSLKEFNKLNKNTFINKSVPYNWILHLVSENQRVLEAKKAIEKNNMQAFGDLLTESGRSAIYDYQLAEDAPELIWLFETILDNKEKWGIIGTRNMGGGFNATTLSLVKSDAAEYFKMSLQKLYKRKFNSDYYFLEFTPSPSAGRIYLP
jgi:galactokinase